MSKKRKITHPASSKPAAPKAPAPKPVSKASKVERKPKQVWLYLGLGIAAMLIVAAAFLLKPQPVDEAKSVEIPVAEAYQRYQEGTFFLDVRTQLEWDEAHLAKSKLIPLDELEARVDELPRDEDIVVICRSGNRSKQAVKILQEAGFTRLEEAAGGINAWKAAGYPVESNTP